MIAFGRLASMSAIGIVDGTISLKTRHSRTRRAISWAYWAPKSTTRTVSKGSAVIGPSYRRQTAPSGSRSSPGAPDGTAGRRGSTGGTDRYDEPRAGRGSASPSLGQNDIARSACAVIVND